MPCQHVRTVKAGLRVLSEGGCYLAYLIKIAGTLSLGSRLAGAGVACAEEDTRLLMRLGHSIEERSSCMAGIMLSWLFAGCCEGQAVAVWLYSADSNLMWLADVLRGRGLAGCRVGC